MDFIYVLFAVILTDEEIKATQQKLRVRELLTQSGLGDENLIRKSEEDDNMKRERSDQPAHPPRKQSIADVRQEMFKNNAREDEAADNDNASNATGCESYFNDISFMIMVSVRRKSVVRFGTSEFSDPTFQSKIEAMLGSNVKK